MEGTTIERVRCTIALRPHSYGRFNLAYGDPITPEILAEGPADRRAAMIRTRFWGTGWRWADGTVDLDVDGA